ncbi:MAG: hypothetical protein ABI612_22445 [Betaproteobacteria bacterium]
MTINPKLRVGLLIGALVLTVAAVRWATGLSDGNDAAPGTGANLRSREPRSVQSSQSQNAAGLDLQRLQRGRDLDPDADPFGARNFRPPPPKPKPLTPEQVAAQSYVPPPPPPQAPPLPFSYMGKLAEDQSTTVFLISGDRNLVVKLGDVIDNTYRLDEVTESNVVLTYLPINQRQSLPIGVQ